MVSRTILGSILLCAVACFAEPTTSVDEQCVDGKPGCDCGVDDACDAGLECVVSIDKCVPPGCTPGALTCTCTDAGGCDGSLRCDGGVCLEPHAGTTGHDSGIADASTAGPDGSSSATGGATETLGTLSTTDLPTTTLTSDTLEGSITDVTDATLSTDSGASEGGPFDCEACLDAARFGGCAPEYSACITVDTPGGCAELQACVFDDVAPIADCCQEREAGHLQWNAFALCADGMECMGMCTSSCPV